MSAPVTARRGVAVALLALLAAGCVSDDGYGGYGGANVAVGMSYGYYDPYYPYYYGGYPCCWYDDGGRPIQVPPPGERPPPTGQTAPVTRATTLRVSYRFPRSLRPFIQSSASFGHSVTA